MRDPIESGEGPGLGVWPMVGAFALAALGLAVCVWAVALGLPGPEARGVTPETRVVAPAPTATNGETAPPAAAPPAAPAHASPAPEEIGPESAEKARFPEGLRPEESPAAAPPAAPSPAKPGPAAELAEGGAGTPEEPPHPPPPPIAHGITPVDEVANQPARPVIAPGEGVSAPRYTPPPRTGPVGPDTPGCRRLARAYALGPMAEREAVAAEMRIVCARPW